MVEFFTENREVFLWLFVAVAAVVVEVNVSGLVSIWFVPGALIAMILSLFIDNFLVQTLVFLVVSLTTLLLSKTVFRKLFPKKKEARTNADALIGMCGIVKDPIDNLHETGSVKVNSLIWSARSTDDKTVIPTGSIVTVKEISGVKLICSLQADADATNQQEST